MVTEPFSILLENPFILQSFHPILISLTELSQQSRAGMLAIAAPAQFHPSMDVMKNHMRQQNVQSKHTE
jgi:hypothetical protein